VSTGRDFYAGACVNFAMSPRAKLYVKGGYTNARLKIEHCCADNGDGFCVGPYVGPEYATRITRPISSVTRLR
jgi:hypothetical protein